MFSECLPNSFAQPLFNPSKSQKCKCPVKNVRDHDVWNDHVFQYNEWDCFKQGQRVVQSGFAVQNSRADVIWGTGCVEGWMHAWHGWINVHEVWAQENNGRKISLARLRRRIWERTSCNYVTWTRDTMNLRILKNLLWIMALITLFPQKFIQQRVHKKFDLVFVQVELNSQNESEAKG